MTQAKRTSKTPSPPSGNSNLLFGLAVAAVVAGGAYLFLRPSAPEVSPQTDRVTQDVATQATTPDPLFIDDEIPTAPPKIGQPEGVPLPDLPLDQYTAARPTDQVREAFTFAAMHPEVLQYVPCFCGCENLGHEGNDNCFVADRDADGRVTAWELHGIGCAVCLDVATDARRMYASGASVTQIRTAIENKYRPLAASMTPTPMPEHE